MSDKQKPVVHLAMDAEMESEFRAMERLGQLVQWLDEVSTPTAQAELKNIIPSIEWSSLSLKTVDGFIATASSQSELVNALNTWKSLQEQREARARLEAEYAEKLSTRRQGMESALELKPDAPFNFRTTSSNQLIKVELLHSMGIVMHHELPRPPDNLQPPDPLELRTEKIAIQIHGPKIYQSQFGQRSQVSILGNEGRIALITTQEKQADLYLLASIEDPQLLLDLHALPDGSQSRRYIALKGDNWKAEVRLGEDPRLLFDRLYFEDLSKALSDCSGRNEGVTSGVR